MSTETEPRVNQSRFSYGCQLVSIELERIAQLRRKQNCMTCGSVDRVKDALCFSCRAFVLKYGTNP
jgi:hypothetical protein